MYWDLNIHYKLILKFEDDFSSSYKHYISCITFTCIWSPLCAGG